MSVTECLRYFFHLYQDGASFSFQASLYTLIPSMLISQSRDEMASNCVQDVISDWSKLVACKLLNSSRRSVAEGRVASEKI